MGASKPENEAARVEALRQYRLLDTAPERAFDDLTALASHACGTPIALVVLPDDERQWFESKVGLAAAQTPREHGFCAHAIPGVGTMVVEDARADGRFAANPLVTAAPFIRFYAGAPLIGPSGHSLGTLCVIDPRPRHLDAGAPAAPEALARLVVEQMELRRVAAELAGALESPRALRPDCAWCKRVRDDAGYWRGVEDYLRRETGAEPTHGICPARFADEAAGGG